ncbi:MAG: PQQ-binding-like beta-propeller repeat protein [Thermoanaerobaculia bacterium]
MRLSGMAAFAAWLVLGGLPSSARAADWPGWRGPARDGQVAGFVPPKAWPGQLRSLWSTDVGLGHASPVVVGERVFVHGRVEQEEVVTALSLADGKVLWRMSYPAPYTMNPAAFGHGPGPKSTPLVAEGKLFTLGISGILSAFDAEKGALLWRQDLHSRFVQSSPLYGTAMSPILADHKLVVHLGGQDQGALLAFDPETGKELWSQPFDGPGYASPVIAEVAGVKQLVTQSQRFLVGVALADGALLWQLPFTTEYVQNIVTPLVVGDVVYYSGLDKGLMAARITRVENEKGRSHWSLAPLWANESVPLYMSSPVLAAGQLCGLSHKRKGQLFCVDPKDGRLAWSTPGRDGENAALEVAGDLLLALTDDASLIVARAGGAAYQELARYKAGQAATWAHPVVIGNRILVRSVKDLTLWQLEVKRRS